MNKSIYKKCISSILMLVVFISTAIYFPINQIPAYAATTDAVWPEAPEITSGSAIVIDADSGAILYQKEAHSKAYPASLTKTMTGLLTIENCSLDEVVTYSARASGSVTWEDAKINVKTGEQLTVEQSLYALLLHSANEVAYGLGEHVAGSITAFTDLMNSRARELGAINTHFNNASGLSDPNHYTTAYDLAMIGRGCFNNATFMSFEGYSESYKIPPTNMTTTTRTINARHQMLKNGSHYYEYCKGGKTGFTDESGYTLLTFAEKDGMRLICVTLRSTDNDRYVDTKTLFDYCFNNFKKVSISNNDINSIFNSSNYYNSNVFSTNDINFSLNASYVNLPVTASINDIAISVNTDAESTDDFAANIDFKYGDNLVGTADLSVVSANDTNQSSNLPYITSDKVTQHIPKKCIVINIWALLIIFVVAMIVIYVLQEVKRSRRYSRRRRRKYPRNIR